MDLLVIIPLVIGGGYLFWKGVDRMNDRLMVTGWLTAAFGVVYFCGWLVGGINILVYFQ